MHTAIRKTALAALLVTAGPLYGWSAEGHRLISAAALELLDSEVSRVIPFDRAAMMEAATQPDLMRPETFIQLRDREAPEHYLDLERLRGRPLPPTRTGLVRLVAALAERPDRWLASDWTMETVGSAPYAVVEGTQRLAVAFAQLRRQPDDSNLRLFAMLHAGVVAHYAQDLCQPLHTTVHFDGRLRADGTSPRTGLHAVVDGLLRARWVDRTDLRGRRSRAFEDLFAAVVRQLEQSHDLVEQVYRLESELRQLEKSDTPTEALRAFAHERYREAVAFTADLLHSAWVLAQSLEMR